MCKYLSFVLWSSLLSELQDTNYINGVIRIPPTNRMPYTFQVQLRVWALEKDPPTRYATLPYGYPPPPIMVMCCHNGYLSAKSNYFFGSFIVRYVIVAIINNRLDLIFVIKKCSYFHLPRTLLYLPGAADDN